MLLKERLNKGRNSFARSKLKIWSVEHGVVERLLYVAVCRSSDMHEDRASVVLLLVIVHDELPYLCFYPRVDA